MEALGCFDIVCEVLSRPIEAVLLREDVEEVQVELFAGLGGLTICYGKFVRLSLLGEEDLTPIVYFYGRRFAVAFGIATLHVAPLAMGTR